MQRSHKIWIFIAILAIAMGTISAQMLTDIALIKGVQVLEIAKKSINNINTDELLDLLDNNPNAVLIDVRTDQEINITGTIRRGQNINIPRGLRRKH